MAAKKAKRKTPARATSASSSPRKRGSSKLGGSKKLDSRVRGNDGKARTASLLVELLTEELPPKSLKRLSETFGDTLANDLRQHNFLTNRSEVKVFATPRRLAVLISHVLEKAADHPEEHLGPSVKIGLDPHGKPTPALLGFARKFGVDVSALEQRDTSKGTVFVLKQMISGGYLETGLDLKVDLALKALPVAKQMRWGDGDVQFVRPVHGLVMLHGNKTLAGTVLALESGNTTLGHRFQAPGPVRIPAADQYESTLHRAKVIASFAKRREAIARGLLAAAAKQKVQVFPGKAEQSGAASAILAANEALLDEVTAIVEWPVVYGGEFDADFLSVPAQALSLTMQKNQKYFALVDGAGELRPAFLVVSNVASKKPEQVVHGNERVLRARLADARFFYEQDKKTRLETRFARLANVVYQHKLGNQYDRVRRIEQLALAIGDALGFGALRVPMARAAHLCKADLVSDMVGEFPELQGVMGSYYARHDGEEQRVADAIEAHYRPRFAGDALPSDPIGLCVALADKLETLVGIYGVGLVPTGDKDPYGLRRAALGVVRILVEKELPLDVPATLKSAAALFAGKVGDKVAVDVYGFMLDRLRSYLRERGFKPDEIEAVLALTPARLDQIVPRLTALQHFRRLPEAASLAAANKRIRNILRQAGGGAGNAIDASLLHEDAERTLAAAVVSQREAVTPLLAAGDYTGALKRLAQLREPVDVFFDKVMVMAEDEALKRNRLALLHDLSELFLGTADIARLQD